MDFAVALAFGIEAALTLNSPNFPVLLSRVITVNVFIVLDLLQDVSLRLSQTLAWSAAAEHSLCAVTFSLINGGKVYRRIAVSAPVYQPHGVACFF